MRAIVPALVALACVPAAVASDSGNSITRHGNTLIVTAPETESVDPHLAAALRSRISIDAVDMPLSEVGDFIHDATGANVVLAPELRIEQNPITLQAKDMSAANVVSWVSRLAHCSCVPLHGALYFTRDTTSAPRVTKLYDISGLTIDLQDFPGPELAMNANDKKGGGGFTLFEQKKDDHGSADERGDEVIEMIKKHVAPGTWGE